MTVNNRAIVLKDTEQDIVLAPAAHWQHALGPKLEYSVRKQKRSLKSDFTSVVVSVTQRKEPDFLVAWGELYRAGKKPRLNLSFNYVSTSHSSTTSLGRADKRGSLSTTRQMLAEEAAQLDAEQTSFRHPSIWREVYNLMPCTGPPCNLRPHC